MRKVKTGIRKNRSFKLSPSGCFALILIMVLFYFSYRYIFQWANDITSGTYANTPRFVQMMKYMICMGLLFLAVVVTLAGRTWAWINPYVYTGLLFLCCQSVHSFLRIKDASTMVILTGTAAAFMMYVLGAGIRFSFMDTLFSFYLYFSIFYELIQIFLYVKNGRLPAIAWPDAGLMQVRFGGAFDDPLAFSLFMAFLIPYTYQKYTGFKRLVLTCLLLVFLVLTWTLTSILALTGVYLTVQACSVLKNGKQSLNKIILFLIACSLMAVFLAVYGETFLNRLFEVKGNSIRAHFQSVSLEGLGVTAFLGLNPVYRYSESGPFRMLFSAGILFTFIFYAMGVYSAGCLYQWLKHIPENIKQYRPLVSGMFYYQICFLIGSLNLPFPYMFFNMLLFSLFMGMSFLMNSYRKYRKQNHCYCNQNLFGGKRH